MHVEVARIRVESLRMRVKSQCVDSTRMRMIVFQTAAGMCLQLRFMQLL
jgi:hypothetical protein